MKCLRFLAAAALVLASSPALAQFYLFAGAGGGNAKLDGDDFPAGFGIARRDDSKDVTYHLGVGYRYNANWAVEVAAADLGDYSIHRVDFLGDSLTARYKVHGLKTAVLGIYPATERFLIFGKLGIATTKAELEGTLSVGGVQTPLSSGERRNSLIAGFGVQYSVTRRLGVRAEFENWGEVGNEVVDLTDTGRAKVSSWNLLGVFTF